MTCIVGIVAEDGTVWMGGDRASSQSNFTWLLSGPKVFKKDGWLIGSAGSSRVGDILEYQFEPPAWRKGKDTTAYLVTDFIPDLRKALKTHGVLKAKDGVDEFSGTFLIGGYGRLFAVWDDFQVQETSKPYMAIGSGGNVAMGVLHATARLDITAAQRVEYALDAAAELTPFVNPPFDIVDVPDTYADVDV